MSQLEDLLREALADAPTPESSMADSLATVHRRVRRLRIALASGGLAVVAAAAAVVVPLSLGGHGRSATVIAHPRPTAPSTGTPQPRQTPGVTPFTASGRTRSAAYGAGSVWTLDTVRVTEKAVVQRDPRGGEARVTVSVPASADRIAFGLGRLWVLAGGGGDAGTVSVVDPSSGQLLTHVVDRGAGPSSIAFAGGVAWVTLPSADRVVGLRVGRRLQQVASVGVPSEPTDIVATGDGQVWVRESRAGRIADIDISGARPVLAATQEWSGPLLAPAGSGAVWTTDGARLVRLTPGALIAGTSVAQGVRVALPAPPVAVAADGRGVWVALGSGAPAWTLGYFSAAGLAGGAAQPSAAVNVGSVSALVDDPLGRGVVFVTDGGAAGRWSPAM